MKSTLLTIALVAAAGLCFTLALSGCSSDDLGASSASVSGVGDTCTKDSDCNATLECEHGSCQAHNRDQNRADAGLEDDNDDPGDNDDDQEHQAADGGVQTACLVATDCAAGQECDDGFCKADGGDGGGGHHGGDDGSDG